MAESQLIKKPYLKEKYTKDKINEIYKCTHDPIYFSQNYIYVQHPTKGNIKFNMYDYQKRMVNDFYNHSSVVCLCSRQMGKTLHFNCNITKNKSQVKIGTLLKLSCKEKVVAFLENILVKLAT